MCKPRLWWMFTRSAGALFEKDLDQYRIFLILIMASFSGLNQTPTANLQLVVKPTRPVTFCLPSWEFVFQIFRIDKWPMDAINGWIVFDPVVILADHRSWILYSNGHELSTMQLFWLKTLPILSLTTIFGYTLNPWKYLNEQNEFL